MSNIDFSKIRTAEDEAAFNEEERRHAARHYLASTDWMVIRQVETGTTVPEDVSLLRAEARQVAS